MAIAHKVAIDNASGAAMLTSQPEIQAWVMERHGQPSMIRTRNRFGEMMRSRLALHFHRAGRRQQTYNIDQGEIPIGWTAWLAELDRQGLGLKVDGDEFEIVSGVAMTLSTEHEGAVGGDKFSLYRKSAMALRTSKL